MDAHIARKQFGQIMDRAVDNHDASLWIGAVNGVVIMSIHDFINAVAPAPQWVQNARADAKKRGLAKLSSQDVDAEIKAYRREKRKKKWSAR